MAKGSGRILPKGGKARREKLRAGLRELARKQHEVQQRSKTKPTVTAEPKRPRRGRATEKDYREFFDDIAAKRKR